MQNEKNNLLFDRYSQCLEIINGVKFTQREIDIIALVVSGRSSKKIAILLSISARTVENHIRNIMMKLECNSREDITDFFEKTEVFLEIKKHYLLLLTQAAFRKALQHISTLVAKKEQTCFIIYWREYDYEESLIHWLAKCLESTGIKVSLEAGDSYPSVAHMLKAIELQHTDHIVYSLPEMLPERFQKNHNGNNIDVTSLCERFSKNSITFLQQNKMSPCSISQIIRDKGYICLDEQENHHFLFFSLIKRIFPGINFENALTEYNQQYRMHSSFFKKNVPPFVMENQVLSKTVRKDNFLVSAFKKWKIPFITGCAFGLSFIFILFLTYSNINIFSANQESKTPEKLLVRSDLPLPAETTLLQRLSLLEQISTKLKQQQGIQTIALIGYGGAGKTTLARQFARTQKSSVIWEINAETRESLINSFENFAYALSKTDEEKKILRGLQNLKNLQEREDKLLLFVKERLRLHSEWVLIYDNVEKFTAIQKYFPYDPLVWGKGKVLITTTDSNIGANSYVNHYIQIGELNSIEKLNLFTKIMHSEEAQKLTPDYINQLKRFLEKIPPFPLDISTAAYYLKATNITFERYLDHLNSYHKDFTLTQESILKEASDYTKTRYSIIILSLKRLIETHKDFSELLLLVSLLDSQNIPKAILDNYKSSTIVDSFVYHLNKYSLITNESSGYSSSTFSVHRNTQEIGLVYLKTVLALDNNEEILRSIAKVLEKYVADAVDKEDFSRMKLLMTHCETFLMHKDLLKEKIKYLISSALGCSYYYLRNHTRAKLLLEDSLKNLSQCCVEDYNRNARLLVYLGNVYRANGQFEKAKNLLEQSYMLYQKCPENHVGAARALGYLGLVYESMGNYKQAKDLLEQSLIIYEKHSQNHIGHAWVLAHLGTICKTLGESQEAKNLFEQSLVIYKQYAEDYVGVAWVLGFLGDVYRSLGDYKKAIIFLEQSLVIYRKHFPENHVYAALSLSYIGIVHKEIGNYKKAQSLLEGSLAIFENHYGKNHIKTVQVLRDLGRVYLLEKRLDVAEALLNKALVILQQHNHPEMYTCLEYLTDLYLNKYMEARQKGDRQQSQKYKDQANYYSKQALDIVNINFPKNSPHSIRLQSKFNNIIELDSVYE